MAVELLKEQLIERWKLAFNQVVLLDEFESKSVQIKYASTLRYELKDFDGKKIKPGGRFLSAIPSDPTENFYEYGIEERGLPCFSRSCHKWNAVYWRGFYSFKNDLAEHVEFCIDTGIPSTVERVVFEHGRKISYQSLHINGGGSGSVYYDMPVQQIIESILTDSFSLICTVKEFVYDNNDKVTKAGGLSVGPGPREYKYEDVYMYDVKGKLETITTYFETGETRLAYKAPNKQITFKELSDNLSEKMAHSIVDQMVRLQIEQPLAVLQITYRCVANYHPSLNYVTDAEKQAILQTQQSEEIFTGLFISVENFIDLTDEGFESELQQFVQLMEAGEKWMAGTRMIRKTASILTRNKLEGRIKVSDDFVAFAIDWSIKHEGFAKILKDCGVKEETIKDWKKKKWIGW
ncbi:MAG: hypothetical protein JWQ09_551 [Segetibacter sp.]|nr:hypothetical protein [Segetibacter sp.]